jgi:hypothetical protein
MVSHPLLVVSLLRATLSCLHLYYVPCLLLLARITPGLHDTPTPAPLSHAHIPLAFNNPKYFPPGYAYCPSPRLLPCATLTATELTFRLHPLEPRNATSCFNICSPAPTSTIGNSLPWLAQGPGLPPYPATCSLNDRPYCWSPQDTHMEHIHTPIAVQQQAQPQPPHQTEPMQVVDDTAATPAISAQTDEGPLFAPFSQHTVRMGMAESTRMTCEALVLYEQSPAFAKDK